jgi:transposase
MASLDRIRKGKRSYWRIVESRRVNGKPRPVPIMYLGTADDLLNRLLGAPRDGVRLRSFQHGDVAALTAMAERIGLASIIDRHAGAPRRSLSVGTTLVLAMLNRAIEPKSKRGWARWAETTSIHRLFRIDPSELTSQFFWDQMDAVPVEAVERIEAELTCRIVELFDIKLDVLFYDTTNFFTYIASTNDRPKLPQRGRSKQRRYDLRQFSLAALVSRAGHVPLCSQLYEGNKVDSTQFPESLTTLRRRMEALVENVEELTVVYDRGNNSKANQALVDEADFHYVASLTPSQHTELLNVPVAEYSQLSGGRLDGVRAYRCRREIWDAERTLVLFISDQLRAGQLRGLRQHLAKRLRELEEWKRALAKPRSGPRKPDGAAKRIEKILAGQHIKRVLSIRFHPERTGEDRLTWSVDHEEIERLSKEVFGKRLLMTDRHDWTTEDIIQAYHGQSHVEDIFRQIKDPDHLAMRPQFHWTDQKIHVHAFICVTAYLLARLVHLEAREAGYEGSLCGLLDDLATVRLAMMLEPSGKQGGRPRCRWRLEERDPQIDRIYRRLTPDRPPFMYTPDDDS